MSQTLRIILMTGPERRHRYAAQQLAQTLQLVGIVSEVKAPKLAKADTLPNTDQEVIDKHFAQRDAAEIRWLGEDVSFPDVERLDVPNKESNSQATYDWITARSPDYIILYGTSIIKPPLLDDYSGKLINCHLGLSPYYRGSGTNFWPLVHGKPECVGATIHLVVLKVDAGAILAQIRPELDMHDNAHDLGTKVIMAAFKAMPEVVKRFDAGEIKPQEQDLSIGEVFRRRDFNAEAVRTVWQNLENGMMGKYAKNITVRQAKYPIIEFTTS